MASSVIGNLQILVSADLSQLQDDLARIPALLADVSGSLDVSTATSGLDTLGGAITNVGTDAEATGGQLGDLNQHLSDGESTADSLGQHLEGLKDNLIDLAGELGVTFSAYEILKESFGAFSEIQKAQIALTAMTGDADAVEASLGRLRDIALDNGLSFPTLVQADQRLVALGVDSAQIPGLLQTMADAAAATGNAFDTVANAIDRMSLSGTAGARQLVTLGLNLQQLADALNASNPAFDATAANAAALFKALDQSDRITILEQALDKFSGAGVAAGQSLAGEWQNSKTQLEASFEEIGAALEPLASKFLTFVSGAIHQELIDEANDWQRITDEINGLNTAFDDLAKKYPTLLAIANLPSMAYSLLTGQGGVNAGKGNTNNPLGGADTTGNPSLTATQGGLGSIAAGVTVPTPDAATALAQALTNAQAALTLVNQAMKEGVGTGDELIAAEVGVHNAFLDANAQFKGQSTEAQTTSQMLGITTDAFRVLSAGIDATAANGDTYVDSLDQVFQKSQAAKQAAFDYAAGLEQQATDVQQVAGFQQIMMDNLSSSSDLLDLNQKVLADNTSETKNFYQSIDQLDKQGYASLLKSIPAATALQSQFHDEVVLGIPDLSVLQTKLDNANTAYKNVTTGVDASGNSLYTHTQKVQADIAQLEAEIPVLQEQGKSTDDVKAKIDLLNKSIESQPTLWSTAQAAMENAGKALSTGLGTAIDAVIGGTKTLGQAFQDLGLQIVDVIVNTIIAKGVQVLIDQLAKVVTGFGSIATSAASAGTSAASGAAGGAASAAGGAATSAGGAAASGGASAVSSAAGLLGDLGSIGSIVGAVASVGAGITAGLQAATTNDHLFHIMSDTAYIKGYLADIHGWAHDTVNSLQGILDWEQSVIHADLVNISGGLDTLNGTFTQASTYLSGMYNLALIQTAIAARSATGAGALNVTLTGADPRAVAQQLAGLLGLSAPNFA